MVINLLSHNHKIVEIKYVDMDTAGGKIVNKGCAEFGGDVAYGADITIWMSFEAGCEVEEILEKKGFCEIITGNPFEQPDGRKFAQLNYIMQ